MIQISVQIMTFHRDAGLRRAVRSVVAQRGIDPATVEILIVDNSAPKARRKSTVDELTRDAADKPAIPSAMSARRGRASRRRAIAGIRQRRRRSHRLYRRRRGSRARLARQHAGDARQVQADAVGGPVLPIFEDGRPPNDPFWGWIYDYDEKVPSGSTYPRHRHRQLPVLQIALLPDRSAVRSRPWA